MTVVIVVDVVVTVIIIVAVVAITVFILDIIVVVVNIIVGLVDIVVVADMVVVVDSVVAVIDVIVVVVGDFVFIFLCSNQIRVLFAPLLLLSFSKAFSWRWKTTQCIFICVPFFSTLVSLRINPLSSIFCRKRQCGTAQKARKVKY